ncbi:MAG TPA: hypothetical protein VGJ13_04780 [Pseudonocardiaceae bacterium]
MNNHPMSPAEHEVATQATLRERIADTLIRAVGSQPEDLDDVDRAELAKVTDALMVVFECEFRAEAQWHDEQAEKYRADARRLFGTQASPGSQIERDTDRMVAFADVRRAVHEQAATRLRSQAGGR